MLESRPRVQGHFAVVRTAFVPVGARHYDAYPTFEDADETATALNKAGSGVLYADPFTEVERADMIEEWPWSVIVEEPAGN